MSKEEKKKKEKVKIKPNKHRRYSFINAIDEAGEGRCVCKFSKHTNPKCEFYIK